MHDAVSVSVSLKKRKLIINKTVKPLKLEIPNRIHVTHLLMLGLCDIVQWSENRLTTSLRKLNIYSYVYRREY